MNKPDVAIEVELGNASQNKIRQLSLASLNSEMSDLKELQEKMNASNGSLHSNGTMKRGTITTKLD